MLTELPFGNRTVKLAVTGEIVWARWRMASATWRTPQAASRRSQASRFTADLTKPAGQRVTEVMVGGQPLDTAATYTLAISDYLYGGGDGYDMFGAAKPLLGVRDGRLMANDVMAYITSKKTVAPKVEGRIELKM